MYGVYSNYDSDVSGDYKVTVGVEVTKPKNAIVIEDKKYLVFTKQGELPNDWKLNYGKKFGIILKITVIIQRAFEIDFEKICQRRWSRNFCFYTLRLFETIKHSVSSNSDREILSHLNLNFKLII